MTTQVLSALRLAHFRNHAALRMDFDGRPVALVGPNGAGKTNLLEAISLLSPGRGLRRAGAEDFAQSGTDRGWKIAATALDHDLETQSLPNEPRQVRIDGKAAPQNALSRIMRQVWLVPAMDRLWTEGAEGRRRFLDRMTLSFIPDHAEAVLTYEKAMRDRNRLLRDEVTDAGWYDALEAQMAPAATAIAANRAHTLDQLDAAQEGDFPRADLTITDGTGDWPALWAEGRRRDMAAGRTLLGPHRADLTATYAAKSMPAAQCSTGEQKALLLSLILANARALAADGTPPVLLLDEVAAHLDAARRAALYDTLCDLAGHTFMTGTGAELFDSLGPRAQIFHIGEAS